MDLLSKPIFSFKVENGKPKVMCDNSKYKFWDPNSIKASKKRVSSSTLNSSSSLYSYERDEELFSGHEWKINAKLSESVSQ